MSGTLQTFLVDATPKAMLSMEAAIGRLPLEKRDWSPSQRARTALDMAAEVAILNGVVARVIEDRSFPADFEMAGFLREKAELARNWDALQALLHQNTEGAVTAIASVPDAVGLAFARRHRFLSLLEHEISRRPDQLHRFDFGLPERAWLMTELFPQTEHDKARA